jgi:glycosyltransferase involved in cell wall biosynthesis
LIEGGVPAEKISVVPDGVPLLDGARWSPGGRVLAPANAGDPRKGAALALEAARLAGVSLEYASDLERDLAGASVFVYISFSEGLGSGALLAMSAGVPVVASHVGGLAEVIRDRENGMLVDNSPHAIAGAVRQLLDHPDLARRIAAAGRVTIEQQFSVAAMVSRTMEVYRRVLT